MIFFRYKNKIQKIIFCDKTHLFFVAEKQFLQKRVLYLN